MQKINILALSAALAALLPGSYAAAAHDVQGRVVSMMVTKDCPAEGVCAANVALMRADGKLVTFHVRPDTEIMRGNRLISLSQLGLGDVVSIPAYDQITTDMRSAKPIVFD